MTNYKRNYNLNILKKDYSYSIQEITETLGVTKRTVGRWIKQGLVIVDNKRPYLIHSEDLRDFLKQKQSKRRHKCKPNELFCLKCKQPRNSINNEVDIFIHNEKISNIKGVCSICFSKMNRGCSVKNLSETSKPYRILEIHNLHLIEGLSTTDTVLLKKEAKTEVNTP